MLAKQLSFVGLFMLEELAQALSLKEISFFQGESYILFETNTFGHLVHTIDINEESEEYLIKVNQFNKAEKIIKYTQCEDVIYFIKKMQN